MITDYSIQAIAINAIPLIFAITIHEAAHGYAARYFGDNTAYVLGRVSLNPAKHIDPIGTVLVPLMLILAGSPFWWGMQNQSQFALIVCVTPKQTRFGWLWRGLGRTLFRPSSGLWLGL